MTALKHMFVFILSALSILTGCSANKEDINYYWTRLTGAAGAYTYGRGISADSSGNIYVTGYTAGNLDGQTLTGQTDVVVIKYDSSGIKQWTKLLGVANSDTEGFGISADSTGNIYVTGITYDNLDGQTLTGTQDVFVIKYDSSGTKQWTKLLGVASASTYGSGISASDGSIYVTGYTSGNLDGQTLTGNYDVFVIKYNSSGTKQWTKLLGVASASTIGRVISASDSSIYVTGETAGDLDGQIKTGQSDVFVIKYDSSGTLQWTRLLGVAGAITGGYGISASSGNIYVTGYTSGNLDGQTKTGTQDVFVIKYDSSGTLQWTRLMGAAGAYTYGRGISADSSGNIYVTGYTAGNLDGLTLTGTYDVFVIKYSSSGTKQWTKLLGVASASTIGVGLTVTSYGITYVTGSTTGNLDGQALTGTSDLFITSRLYQ